MRKYSNLFLLSGMYIFVMSCQKEISKPREKKFDDDYVKEWYYGTFKKSPEWASSNQKGKKLPDWNHPVIGKLGDYDVVEFPLKKATKTFSINARNVISEFEKKRIAEASLSKILFIKKKNGEIVIREIDLVPDLRYLQVCNYDISSVSVLKKDNDFSGNQLIKKWDGTLLYSCIIEKGKITKSLRLKNKNSGHISRETVEPLEECTTITYCIFQQDCEWILYGDALILECGPWYNTGTCWDETMCWEVDPCIYFPEECDDPEPDPGGCESASCEDADAALANITSEDLVDLGYSCGSESQPDPNGIISKSCLPTWVFFKLNFVGNYWVRYTANFSAIIWRYANSSQWKFESISYQSTTRTGIVPPCFSLEMETVVSPPEISTNQTTATVPMLQYDCEVNISCLGGYRVSTYSKTVTNGALFVAQ